MAHRGEVNPLGYGDMCAANVGTPYCMADCLASQSNKLRKRSRGEATKNPPGNRTVRSQRIEHRSPRAIEYMNLKTRATTRLWLEFLLSTLGNDRSRYLSGDAVRDRVLTREKSQFYNFDQSSPISSSASSCSSSSVSSLGEILGGTAVGCSYESSITVAKKEEIIIIIWHHQLE